MLRGLITSFAAGLVALTAVAANGAGGPTVWLAHKSPATVVGTGFGAGRNVAVTYTAGTKHLRRTVTAGPGGRIKAVFGGVSFARCGGVEIVAGDATLLVRPCSSPGGRPVLTGTQSGIVRGAAFVPREHVQLLGRVSGQAPVTASMDAGPAGAFVGRVPVRRVACAEVFYRATGSLGSTATFTVAAPDCKSP